MKKMTLLSLALCLTLISPPARADQTLIGTLVSAAGGEIDNATTAVPFSIKGGTKIDVQCSGSAAVRFETCSTSTCTATTTSFIGLRDSTTQTYQLDPSRTKEYVSILPVSATATTCYLYAVQVN